MDERLKPWQWGGVTLGALLFFYAVLTHMQYFGSISFLGAVLLVEVVVVSLWKYERRFFLLLMIAFLWAGMNVPMQGAWTGGRWFVLSAGAMIGYIIWLRAPSRSLRTIHLLAFFCMGAALVSATVSPFVQMASYKAVSLCLLFLYCSSGARLGVIGREERFFRGLVLAGEIAVVATAVCYFVLGEQIWGNPNSLGAAMSIGVFPILLWGWFVSDSPGARLRRLSSLLLCSVLVIYSLARAGIVSIAVVTVVFCLCLHQYRLLAKIVGLTLALVAVIGMLAPQVLNKATNDLEDSVLYKNHREQGLFGSRQSPWEKSISAIKAHPLFGTGYGTSPSGEDPGLYFGKFASSAETAREHGSSYMTIMEWVGLLGVMPFLALVGHTLRNVWRVCGWMKRTLNFRHYSVPLAMVVLSGAIHANFEDWMFAVGAYPCVYFWVFAFLLADLLPPVAAASKVTVMARPPMPIRVVGAVASNR
ncbi:MAG TPA: O-antigen ligase family protein [Terriglobales bacterium]|nr:O-antigen ligase family protein [Terriglobales bacterium]